jgi:membrane fusion protein, macrolide-specific efflux system
MMKQKNKITNRYKIIFVVGLLLIILLGLWFFKFKKSDKLKEENLDRIYPTIGNIQKIVSTTGGIEPQNRVEIIPPMAGRIEEIFVKEGNKVKKGDVLMKMSSTERAALIDNASSKGTENKKYWEELYKPTPIIASIDGEVIARDVEPGQSVSASSTVLVLSNRLIIKADVDETDISSIKIGQKAIISLDAYPEIKVEAKVEHIAFESTVVNNVTTYSVEIVPNKVPSIFRSGMSSNIDIIIDSKENVLLLPMESIIEKNNKKFVTIATKDGKSMLEEVKTGLNDGTNVEIISGIDKRDIILIKTYNFDSIMKKSEEKTNPFMPNRFNKNKNKNMNKN